MAGLRIFESSGYVSPKVMGIGSPEDFQHDRWFAGDDDATVYHTLIGITGLKVANPAKIIEILKNAGYRGFVALEYEEAESPFEAIPKILEQLRPLCS